MLLEYIVLHFITREHAFELGSHALPAELFWALDCRVVSATGTVSGHCCAVDESSFTEDRGLEARTSPLEPRETGGRDERRIRGRDWRAGERPGD